MAPQQIQDGVDLSDYNIYLNQFGTKHKHHTVNMPEWPNSHNLARWRLQLCWISGKNVNNSGLDKDICTKFYGKMHHVYTEMTKWPKVETGSKFALHHQMNVRSISASISVTRPITLYIEPNLVQSSNTTLWTRRNVQIHITWKYKMAAAAAIFDF